MTVNGELSGHLVDVLEQLDYLGDARLVTAATPSDAGPRGYVWRDLRDRVGLDAAFFHDGVPMVGFSGEAEPANLLTLRRRLWNYGRVPLLVASSGESVTAYNALTLPGVPGGVETSSVGAVDVLAEERRENTARALAAVIGRGQIDGGSFAEQYNGMYKRATKVDKVLLSNLGYLRRSMSTGDPQRRASMDALVGASLMASYLVDRKILEEGHIIQLAQRHSLPDVLGGGLRVTRRFFEGLAERFNGDVFGPVPEALAQVDDAELHMVAALLRGDDLPTGQASLWPYDFSAIPADLVGSIYEQILEPTRRADAAHYTPRFLVDLILDEVIPWRGGDRPTLADLACGSGAFMAETFRRLAYRALFDSEDRLTYEGLTRLLLNHVYGVERNPVAARIAVFSLYLALLEELDPPTIWESAVLPDLLGRNVVVADAFEPHALSDMTFDAVVGNPPWGSRLTPAAAEFVGRARVPVADQQLAQAFVWLAAAALRPGGTLALVMPSKGLLHNRSAAAQSFRAALFRDLKVRAVVDLSAVRREVFATAVAPAAVLVAESPRDSATANDHGEVLHMAVHHRRLGNVVDALVVAPEEIRTITAWQAQTRPDIWKTFLWGGPRDAQLIDRLRSRFPSVGKVAADRAWVYGQGFQLGGGDANDATHMRGLPLVATESVLPLRLVGGLGQPFEHPTLHRPRDPALFRGPHVLVRRTVVRGRLAAVVADNDAVFPNGTIGFAGPVSDWALLAGLAATTVSSLGRYVHFMSSASWGVERDFVEVNEHAALPLASPSPTQARRLSQLFELFQAGDEPADNLMGDLDEVVFDLYGLSDLDRARVREGISLGIERFYHPAAFSAPADVDTMAAYRIIVEDAMSTTLPCLSVHSRVFSHGPYRVVAVTLTDPAEPPARSMAALDIEKIVRTATGQPARTTGIVVQPTGFFLDEDTAYIIKTTDRDRWSHDAALEDAGRVIAAMAFGD